MRQVETKEDGDLTQPDQSTFFMFRQRAASGVMSASALALATAATSARTLASAAVSSASMIQPTKTSLLPPLRESSRLRGQEAIERLSRLMEPLRAMADGGASNGFSAIASSLVWRVSCCTW